ncbi:uncharacterized protein EAF02_008733 [Botrytis sinoallii]|uniref:uncharacterized protein n=1 Tax=Botrytis sinoallii TaxID=1463999 RepID=UPI0018FFF8CA|nr:uncharacterized protein EAF02_008733 [Botrytis sinoallii]KAF7872662.1 hypothetical protein EAF02_008733 [Botrytis sinoallii]
MKTYLDLVNECDTFPYPEKDATAHSTLTSTLYTLIHEDPTTFTTYPLGYITLPVYRALLKVPTSIKGEMSVNQSQRTISLFTQATEPERSAAVAATCEYWRTNKTFEVLSGWRDELYPVYGPGNEVLWSIERSASVLFGILGYGIHMMAYVRCPEVKYGMKLWVPRRSATKQTYPSMLDNTVAGGMSTGEDKFEALVRECMEEASFPEDVVRKNAKAHGALTYFHVRGATAGGETGLMQPECEYIYDLELPADVIPKPNDSEVEQFYLWTVEEVQEHMKLGEFKPNCGIVLLDFFIRYGIFTRENESDFDEIKSRIHRKLPFLGPHNI